MLTFEQFEKYINEIKKRNDRLDEICDVLGGCEWLFDIHMADEVISLLSYIMNDKDDWIAYWVYEQEFGTKWVDDETASQADGTPIVLRTTRQLYDYLVKEYGANHYDKA